MNDARLEIKLPSEMKQELQTIALKTGASLAKVVRSGAQMRIEGPGWRIRPRAYSALVFLYDRLVAVYDESPNVDYMIRAKTALDLLTGPEEPGQPKETPSC